MIRLSGSVKLRCALGLGSSDGGAAGLPGFLRPSAWRCCCFSASIRRSSSAACWPRPPVLPCLLDLRQPFLLVAGPIRHLVAALVLAEGLVLFGVRSLRRRQHPSHLGFQFRLAFLHAFITHRFVFRGVRLDLRAIQRDMAEFDQSCRRAQLQNLQEQRAERLQMPLAEVADRPEVRWIERHNHHKNHSAPGRPSQSAATNTAHSHSHAAEAQPSSAGQTAAARARSHSCP